MSDAAAVPDDGARYLVPGAAVALVAGGGLVAAARVGALALLVAIAVVQAVFALAWIAGTDLPGRRGAVVLALLAGAGSDVAVSVWPHSRLGALLAVGGLAIPAMFAHQLTRGTSRAHILRSLAGIAVLILGVVALAALLQVRHEFASDSALGGRVSGAVVGAIAAALLVGYLVDSVVAVPRFDAEVRRGVPALLVSAAVGAAVAYLQLETDHQYGHGRALFLGAALGAGAALLAVGSAFVLHSTAEPAARFGRALRPVFAALLPLCLLAPGGFLLCLAVRT